MQTFEFEADRRFLEIKGSKFTEVIRSMFRNAKLWSRIYERSGNGDIRARYNRDYWDWITMKYLSLSKIYWVEVYGELMYNRDYWMKCAEIYFLPEEKLLFARLLKNESAMEAWKIVAETRLKHHRI